MHHSSWPALSLENPKYSPDSYRVLFSDPTGPMPGSTYADTHSTVPTLGNTCDPENHSMIGFNQPNIKQASGLALPELPIV